MSSYISLAIRQALLDLYFGNQALTPPATLYWGLMTVKPTAGDGTGGTEVTGGAYARVSKTNNNTQWPATSSGGVKANGVRVDFPSASGSWGSVIAIALFTASSGGNPVAWADVTSIGITNFRTAYVDAADFSLTIT